MFWRFCWLGFSQVSFRRTTLLFRHIRGLRDGSPETVQGFYSIEIREIELQRKIVYRWEEMNLKIAWASKTESPQAAKKVTCTSAPGKYQPEIVVKPTQSRPFILLVLVVWELLLKIDNSNEKVMESKWYPEQKWWWNMLRFKRFMNRLCLRSLRFCSVWKIYLLGRASKPEKRRHQKYLPGKKNDAKK